MRRSTAFIVFLCLLAGQAAVQAADGPVADVQLSFKPPAKAHFKLFLLIGQSNMAGRGQLEARDRKASPRVMKLDVNNVWLPATDPLHFDKPALVGVGLGKTFGEQLALAYPNDTIGLIPCAFGGTSIDDWLNNKPGTVYDNAIIRTRRAMQSGTLAGILWHQGESDVAGADVYAGKAAILFARLRGDLGVGNVPIVVGTLGSFLPGHDPINAAIRQLQWRVPMCLCAESTGLKSKGDNMHFDTPSYRSLGLRYATCWLAMANPKR